MPIEGLFIAIGYEPNTGGVPRLARGRREGLPRRPRRDRLEDRRRVHRRRRPRPSLSPGRDRRRPTAARPRSTPSAGSRHRGSPKPRPRRPGRPRAVQAPRGDPRAPRHRRRPSQTLVGPRSMTRSPTRRPVSTARGGRSPSSTPAAGASRSSAPFRSADRAAGRRGHPRTRCSRCPTSTSSPSSTCAAPRDAFAPGTFDLILSSFTLEHFADPGCGPREPAVVARPRRARSSRRP